MRIYRQAGNIKAALFVGGILLIGGLLFYTGAIIEDLRKESRDVVSLYAQLIVKGIVESEDAELDFVFREIIQKVKFPVIYSNSDFQPVIWRNLPEGEAVDTSIVRKYMTQMDRQNEPISLVYLFQVDTVDTQGVILGYLHYGDSRLIEQLLWLPYIEIGAVALFVLLGFIGFQVIRNNEKRYIWFGLARETAHQLGTPVSSLMGWLDWLKEHPEKTEQTIADMEYDMGRLQQINDRFSKMGSKPVLENVDIRDIINSIILYFERRLPKSGKSISLELESGEDVIIRGNNTLLSWAIENIVKNAIDSIEGDYGKVALSISIENKYVAIRIKDNGKGIPKHDWKNVFRPGYSTKKQGWGLGLSLAKRIIEEFQNGRVGIISSEMNRGTTFEIRLPIA